MQRFLFLLGSGLLVSPLAHAQFGLRAGGTLTHLTTKDPDQSVSYTTATTTSRPGYQVGVYYQVKLGQRFSVVPEVQFSHEAGKINASYYTSETGYEGDYRLRMNFINVPLLVRVKLGPAYLEAGPQLSLLVGGTEKGTDNSYSWGGPNDSNVDRDIASWYRRFDVGPCVGVGIDLAAGFGLNVRGFQGLVSSARKPTVGSNVYFFDYKGSVSRQTLQASLTYQLAAR